MLGARQSIRKLVPLPGISLHLPSSTLTAVVPAGRGPPGPGRGAPAGKQAPVAQSLQSAMALAGQIRRDTPAVADTPPSRDHDRDRNRCAPLCSSLHSSGCPAAAMSSPKSEALVYPCLA